MIGGEGSNRKKPAASLIIMIIMMMAVPVPVPFFFFLPAASEWFGSRASFEF